MFPKVFEGVKRLNCCGKLKEQTHLILESANFIQKSSFAVVV